MSAKTLYSDEAAKGWLPWGALAPFLSVVFVAIPLAAASKGLQSLHLLDAKADPIGFTGLLAFLVIAFGLMGLVALAWVRFVERRPLATIGLAGPHRIKTFLRGHLVGLLTIFSVVAVVWILGGYTVTESSGVGTPGDYGKAFGSARDLAKIGLLLVGFGLQSSVEELFFRGWLLSAITRKFNLVAAVALTSVVFAFLHYEPHQHWLITLNILLFSLFACCWAVRAGNIWGFMGWHAGWNWLLATGFELPVTGLDAKVPALLAKLIPQGSADLTGGAQGPEGSIVCTLFFAGATAFLLWRGRNGGTTLAP